MKFLAILRDSFREALDGWIIYLMIIASGFVILLVASISFRPLTVEEDVRRFPTLMNSLLGFRPPGMPTPRYAIENFQQTNDAPEPWKGDYAFDLVVTLPKAEDKEALKKSTTRGEKMLLLDRQAVRNQFQREQYYYLNNVEVAEPVETPTDIRYHVTTKGTKVESHLAWRHEPKVLFAVPLPFWRMSIEAAVYNTEKWLIHKIGAWLAIMVGIVVTAFFVPNLMRKGAIDLVASKPIRYWQLLLYKYVGGLTFMLILTTATVGGIWLALGLRSGIWGPGFLLVIPGIVFYFAILYAVSVLVAVLTRSAIAAILLTFLVWALFYGAGVLHSVVLTQRQMVEEFSKMDKKEKDQVFGDEDEPQFGALIPKWLETGSDVLHATLPRTSDLDDLNSKLIADSVLSDVEKKHRGLDKEKWPAWSETITVNLAFIAVMLSLACWRFSTRDY